MTTYSFAQLESIWLQASDGTKYHTNAWASLMAAIALAESSGNPDSTNPNDNGGTQTSWGLWQISLGNHAEPSPDWANPIENAKLAIGKLNGQGITAWGTYDSGAYKQFLQGNVPPADVSVTGSGQAGQGASTDGFNPIGWVIGSSGAEFKWFGGLIRGVTGQASTIGDVATGVTGIVRSLTKLTDLFLLLFRPEFWLRVGAFIFGVIALGAGLYFFKEAL